MIFFRDQFSLLAINSFKPTQKRIKKPDHLSIQEMCKKGSPCLAYLIRNIAKAKIPQKALMVTMRRK